MKVPSLIEFYNNQNQLAVQAAGQTAANQTQANLESARLGAEAKRQKQIDQLERFKELMANMRQEKSVTSNEGISMAQILADDARAKLGREFTGSESAADRSFRQKLAEFQQAGDVQKTNLSIGAEKENLQARIDAEKEIAAQRIAAEQPESQARTSLLREQTKVLSGPDVEGTISLLTSIAANRKELEKALGKKSVTDAEGNTRYIGGAEQLRALTQSLTERISAAGVDPTTIPAVVEAKEPEVRARAADLAKTLTSDFDAMKKQGAVQYIQQAQVELQQLIAQGLITDPTAALRKLQSEAKRLGVTASDLS